MGRAAQGMPNFSVKLLSCQRNVESSQQPFFILILTDNQIIRCQDGGREALHQGWIEKMRWGLGQAHPDSAAWNRGLPEKKSNKIHTLSLPRRSKATYYRWGTGLCWESRKFPFHHPAPHTLFPSQKTARYNIAIQGLQVTSCIWALWSEGKSTLGKG